MGEGLYWAVSPVPIVAVLFRTQARRRPLPQLAARQQVDQGGGSRDPGTALALNTGATRRQS